MKTCRHCGARKVNYSARGLCTTCWPALKRAGLLDTLYPPKRPPRGTPPRAWHGRQEP